MTEWLKEWGLWSDKLNIESLERRYLAFGWIKFGEKVTDE